MQQLDKFGWQKLFFSAKTIFVRTVFRVKKKRFPSIGKNLLTLNMMLLSLTIP